MTRTRITSYFTVFVEYDRTYTIDGLLLNVGGIEAIVNPSLTRADIIERLRIGEYTSKTSRVVQIDYTCDRLTDDVTDDLIEAAEQQSRELETA